MTPDELISLLTHLGLRKVHSRNTRQDEILLCCPFHDDNDPSFAVSVTKDGHPCNCFAECFRGTLVGFVMRLEEVPFREALRIIHRFGELEITHGDIPLRTFDSMGSRHDSMAKQRIEWAAKSRFFSSSLGSLRPKHKKLIRDFLSSDNRRMTLSSFPRDNVGWNPSKKAFTFSWRDRYGEICGLSFRQICAPYHKGYDENFHDAGDALFFPVYRNDVDSIIAVEGPFDAIQVWAATGLSACAYGRASPTRAQLSLMADLTEKIIILGDRDTFGEQGIERAMTALSGRADVRSGPSRLLGKDASRTSPALLRKYLLPPKQPPGRTHLRLLHTREPSCRRAHHG